MKRNALNIAMFEENEIFSSILPLFKTIRLSEVLKTPLNWKTAKQKLSIMIDLVI